MKLVKDHRKLITWSVLLMVFLGAYLLWVNNEKVTSADGTMVTNFNDPRRLVGYAEAAFVGRVVEQVGEVAELGMPTTYYQVAVLQPIKSTRKVDSNRIDSVQAPASLAPVVTVEQYGGHRRDTTGKQWLVLMDDQPLLVPGQTYILATTYDEENNWYHVLPLGAIPVETEDKLTTVLEKFKKAEREHIPFEFNDREQGAPAVP